MTTAGLIVREIRHRKLNFVLSVLAILTAAALFVAFYMTGEASREETTRYMRDLGFNLRIVPKDTDMGEFLVNDYSSLTMPEDCVKRMVNHEGLLYNHLVAMLEKKVAWRDRTIILTGTAEEVAPPGKRKPPMIFSVEPGQAVVGFELARSLSIKPGDEIDLFGQRLHVSRCLPESGGPDDVRVYTNLKDAQQALGLPGQINEIKALECLCLVPGKDQLAELRAQLEQILPEAKVIKIQAIAQARQNQRIMMDRVIGVAMPFVLVVCAAWVGVLALLNVRQRRQEIGILRALGYGAGRIASLFLGKAVLAGVLGAGFGFVVGTVLALALGPALFPVTANKIVPAYHLLVWLALVAPVFAAVASLIPTMVAVTQDPAETLSEE